MASTRKFTGVQDCEEPGCQGLRTAAGPESRKPQKAERSESKRPKLKTRARFPRSRMTRPLSAEKSTSCPRLVACELLDCLFDRHGVA